MKNESSKTSKHGECKSKLRAIYDTMDVLSGKWKISIIGYLIIEKKCRFTELQKQIEGIGAKMLSKELKDLEINELITRTVYDTRPITVEYELTPYGKTLQQIIEELDKWGKKHRERIIRKKTVTVVTT
ncbi:HxlR family transcriptional regulator [Arachidicoccus ginsenosidimutans]|uniref:winged helix-turn-helix transcriptional regulator n=1 Tax=Arachidicoccus sp. BS20 TaxID=1850526 RepID=UPI0007F0AF37|nr:helix-turn-helix domain-containing protein [Arachidicoccus sp. BS20]ANI88668.1 HxlR family transcriptional regulator [Arachidicoccus sp. BS20]